MEIDETNNPQEMRRLETIRLIALEIDQFEIELCETTRAIFDTKTRLKDEGLTDEDREKYSQELLKTTERRDQITSQKRSAHDSMTQLKVKDIEREKELVEERRKQERLDKQVLNDFRRFEDLVKLKPSKLNFRDPRDSEQFITDFLEFVEIQLTTAEILENHKEIL